MAAAKPPSKNFNPQMNPDFRRLNPNIAAFGAPKPRSGNLHLR
jgi:hypothetical protein